jgi:cytochrome c biogenesis protein CcmG/thiol:disulfide interchange protein DsbE
MRISFRHWVPLGLFAVVAVVLWQGLRHDPHQLPSTMLHKKFPTLAEHNDWRGQVVVLNVFASWCLSCQIEHPQLMDISAHSKVLWVGLDYMDTPDSMQAFLAANGSPYQQIINDPDGKLAIDLGVYGVPETFVLDKQGTIRYRHAGPLTQALWQTEVKPLIVQLEQA